MTHELRSGDRCRIAANAKIPFHEPGDKGTVMLGPIPREGAKPYYIVSMDEVGDAMTNTMCSADEIEPDVFSWPMP
jgi:hypothetical protein